VPKRPAASITSYSPVVARVDVGACRDALLSGFAVKITVCLGPGDGGSSMRPSLEALAADHAEDVAGSGDWRHPCCRRSDVSIYSLGYSYHQSRLVRVRVRPHDIETIKFKEPHVSEAVLTALISAGVALIVALITVIVSWKTSQNQLVAAARAAREERTQTEESSREERLEAAELASKERRSATLVTALGYFTGGSQNRSVGIAAIRGLEANEDVGDEIRRTIAVLLHGQLLYLLGHGSNRWESHEVGNIQAMIEMYIELAPTLLSSGGAAQVAEAMDRYRAEWDSRHETKVPGGTANEEMVRSLIAKFESWKDALDLAAKRQQPRDEVAGT
jgi:hypothetical protein